MEDDGHRSDTLALPTNRLTASAHAMPTVDAQDLSRDPRRLRGNQEHNRIGDVFGAADASERDVTFHLRLELIWEPSGLHRTGRDEVDGDAIRRQLAGSGATVALQRCFAGAVRDLPWKAGGAIGADVDDPAPGRLPGKVPAREFRHQQGGRPAVDGKVVIMALPADRLQRPAHPVPFPGAGRQERVLATGTRVVDQNLDRSKALLGQVEGNRGCLLRGYVQLMRSHLPAGGVNLGGHGLPSWLSQVDATDTHPLRGQGPRRGCADAMPIVRAGNQCNSY